MPATPIVKATRYFAPGTTKIYFCPAIASKAAPTRAELNAGTDLSREVAEVDGWEVSSDTIDTPDYNSRFTSKISGRTEADDSSLTFYQSSNSQDVRDLLPRDAVGFIVWLDGGDVAGRKCDVYPVQVTSTPKERPDNEAARIRVQFAVTDEPAENVTIPT